MFVITLLGDIVIDGVLVGVIDGVLLGVMDGVIDTVLVGVIVAVLDGDGVGDALTQSP
jgi:hypothetical protein